MKSVIVGLTKMRPASDVFLVGGTKAGTETCYGFLRKHSENLVLRDKQEHFLCKGLFGANYTGLERMTDRIKYNSFSDSVPSNALIGDFDCLSLHGEDAATAIREINPNAKVGVILRNPIERAYSHYWMDVRECLEARSFDVAVREDSRLFLSGSGEYLSIIRLGFYCRQFSALFDVLGSERVRVWSYEEFKRDPRGVITELARFFGVHLLPQSQTAQIPRHNRTALPRNNIVRLFLRQRLGSGSILRFLYLSMMPTGIRSYVRSRLLFREFKVPPVSNSTLESLREIYKDDVIGLESCLGMRLSWM